MISHTPSTTLIELLEWRARDQADKTAFTFLADGETEKAAISYRQLAHQARCVGAQLQQTLEPGARALLLLPSGIEYIVAFFGCLYAGVVAIPAYPPKRNRSDQRLQLIAADAGASIILTLDEVLATSRDLQHAPELNRVPWLAVDRLADNAAGWHRPAISPEHLAFLQYTSGSTGAPKGVMVSHKNLLQNLKELDLGWHHSDRSVMVTWLPMFHDMGLIYGILEPVYKGFSCYLMTPAAFLQQPLRWLKAISQYRGTHAAAPNFAYELCAERISAEQKTGLDLSCWQMALNGAEPIRKEAMLQFTEAFAECGLSANTLTPGYGLAEFTLKVSAQRDTSMARYLTVDNAALNRHKVVLKALEQEGQTLVGCGFSETDTRIVIVDPETLAPCAADGVGEIWVAGNSAAQGYWQRSEETQYAFNAVTRDGQGPFLRTGDLGFLYEGELFITGRLKDVIIIRGLNYYPQDIEAVVARCHPDLKISASAAFSVSADGHEQLVVVQEVERSALKTVRLEAVLGAVRLALAEALDLQPYALVLLKPASIPKTTSGKIQRRLCKERFINQELAIVAQWQRDAVADSVGPESSLAPKSSATIQQWLLTKLAEKLNITPDTIDFQQAPAYYGLDSLLAVTLSGELETWLGRKLSPTLFYDYPNIAAIARFLAQAPGETEASYTLAQDVVNDIAVIGLGCRFPGADSPDAFLALLRSGRQALCDMPLARPNAQTFYQHGEMRRIRRGGFLPQIADFDAAFFQIAPNEVRYLDPQQRLLLEVGWETLEHAGIAPDQLTGSRTGVFIGISTGDYAQLQAQQGIEPNAYAGTGRAFSIAANRLSYILNLQGPSFAVDTACSSSLVAVHQALNSLRIGECDLALVGGVNLIITPALSMTFVEAGMLSPDGLCKTFAADADGYVRGEGCGMVALKRLSDAQTDNDNVLAVIKGSAINQDGHSNGLTAPNGLAQQNVIKQALQNAGVEPAQITFVETHGTGTALGDPIEVNALKAVLMADRGVDQSCLLGSVKANMGHLEAAAGMAGLIKTVLSLQHGEIFPQPLSGPLNPLMEIEQTPIGIAGQTRVLAVQDAPYFAGVSSFGFGGTNAHVVLASPPQSQTSQPEAPTQHLLTLSARTEDALMQLLQAYRDYLSEHPDSDIAALCYTTQSGRNHFNWRCAVVAADIDELTTQLQRVVPDKPHALPKIAMLFTGQGSQYPDMGRELYQTQPYFKQVLDECAELLTPYLDTPLLTILYSEREVDRSKLQQTAYAQPALFALEYALAQLWRSWGIEPVAVAGHSLGEYVAACIAGVFSLEDGLKLVTERGRLMQALPENGAMLAVLTEVEAVTALLQAYPSVTIAAFNGPGNAVVAGPVEVVAQVAEQLAQQAIKTHYLPTAHAFHTDLMAAMLDNFTALAQTLTFRAPTLPWAANVSGDLWRESSPDASYWCQHIVQPVRFTDNIRALIETGCNCFLEIGPKPVLSAMVAQTDDSLIGLPSLRFGISDSRQLLETLAQLYRQGVSVDWHGLHQNFKPQRLTLPGYPFQRQRYWFDQDQTKLSSLQLLQQGKIQEVVASLSEQFVLSDSERAVLPDLLQKLAGEQATGVDADLLYRLEWQQIAISTPSCLPKPGEHWLLFADRKGVAETLSRQLYSHGIASILVYADSLPEHAPQGALTIDANDSASYDVLLTELQTLQVTQIVHCWAVDCVMAESLSAVVLQQAENLTCIALLQLLQALYRSVPVPIPGVTLVSQNALACGDVSINILQAPLIGFAQTVLLEHSDCWQGLIDIDDSETAIKGLLAELLASTHESLIALRQSQRYGARLYPLSEADQIPVGQCDPNAIYLITGGLGALGLSVAQCLAEQGARHLVLNGRRNTPSDSAVQIIEQLTRKGVEITLLAGDISVSQEAQALFTRITTLAKPLKGVIHAAGLAEHVLLLQQTPESFRRITASKTTGTWHLHELTQTAPLDFFICFSSMSVLTGAPGLAGYAAANAFMDALMRYRQDNGLPGMSINWGLWGETGMIEKLNLEQRRALSDTGMNRLSHKQGRHLLAYLLTKSEPQVIAVSMDWAVLQRSYGRPLALIAGLLTHDHGHSSATEPDDSILTQLMQEQNVDQRYENLKGYLRQFIAGQLGFVAAQIDDDAGFSDLGMDSLTAVKTKNALQQVFGRALPATLLINYHSVQALADYFQQLLFMDVVVPSAVETPQALSSDDVEALSEQELAAIIAAKLAATE